MASARSTSTGRRPLDFIPPPSSSDLLGAAASSARPDPDLPGFEYVGSGKAAIAAVLSHLRETGALRDKMSEVLVPRWLGYPVYQTMLEHCFPTTRPDGDPKVLFAYHQYGFPQDMKRVAEYADFRKMILIEDCAHACASSHRGRRLGTFGEYAVFSFSKFAFCAALGGVSSSRPGFAESLARRKAAASRAASAAINGFRWLDEFNLSRSSPRAPKPMTTLRKMFYAAYGDSPLASSRSIRLWEAKRESELAARRENYRLIREAAAPLGLCDGLEADGVTPFIVPLFVPEPRVEAAVSALAELGVRTGSYFFDVARFSPEPDFKRCVPIPCHGAVSADDVGRMVAAVRSKL